MEEILDQIRTKEEADKLRAEIDILLSSLYKGRGDGLEHALRTQVRFQFAELFRSQIFQEGRDVVAYLSDLKKKLEEIEIMILGIAYEANEESIERISDYVNTSFGRRVFLEINYMPELIGGAVVIFGGKYSDFSVKRIFEAEFRGNQEEILAMLNPSGA